MQWVMVLFVIGHGLSIVLINNICIILVLYHVVGAGGRGKQMELPMSSLASQGPTCVHNLLANLTGCQIYLTSSCPDTVHLG